MKIFRKCIETYMFQNFFLMRAHVSKYFSFFTMPGEDLSEVPSPSAVSSLCTLLMGNQQMLSQTLQGLASAAESHMDSQDVSSLLGLFWGLV